MIENLVGLLCAHRTSKVVERKHSKDGHDKGSICLTIAPCH